MKSENNTTKSICVQCGSSSGASPEFKIQAEELGKLLADANIRLIYGGGNVGLMGVLARACLKAGGEVIAVIPESIQSMVEMLEVTQLIVVPSMHERKAKMNELADAFIAMPGGFGTLEELFEVITWNQLHIISKPVAVYNINNYFDGLMGFLKHCCDNKFIRSEHLETIICDDNPKSILDKFSKFQPLVLGKWWD